MQTNEQFRVENRHASLLSKYTTRSLHFIYFTLMCSMLLRCVWLSCLGMSICLCICSLLYSEIIEPRPQSADNPPQHCSKNTCKMDLNYYKKEYVVFRKEQELFSSFIKNYYRQFIFKLSL